MGVPHWLPLILGWGSVAAGVFTIVMGARLLFSAARKPDSALAIDPGKVLEALAKLPQWAAMIIIGYLQILMGFWMLGETLFGYSMLP